MVNGEFGVGVDDNAKLDGRKCSTGKNFVARKGCMCVGCLALHLY